jgi:hypothetical protein
MVFLFHWLSLQVAATVKDGIVIIEHDAGDLLMMECSD